MCGIAGHISLESKSSSVLVSRMLKKLTHRGPDGEGKFISPSVTLGMRRLSIIDLVGGMQPLYNEDKSIVIVGNGEIYNAASLTKHLGNHQPRTGSDIETIIHLYEEYGLLGLNHLKGMFAFCLFDQKKNQVVLARDRMGEKPLYLYETKDGLLFASELKALRSVISSKNLSLNTAAIDKYFHYYFIPEPETIFKQIKKLPKASAIILDLNTKNLTTLQYWQPTKDYYYTDPTPRLKESFNDACSLNMVSDVPVGISLSGGIDSSAILCSLKNQGHQPTALSVGYSDSTATDERHLAKQLAHDLNTPLLDTSISHSEYATNFLRLTYQADDLIADIASFSISSIYRFANTQGFKVLISGIGGDELFYGYDWVRKAVARAEHPKNHNFLLYKAFKTPHYLPFYDTHVPYLQGRGFIAGLYHSYFSSSFPADNSLSPMYYQGGDDMLEKTQFLNRLLRDYWLTSNCIALTDRLSMSHSVEARSPFLDHDLVSTALSSTKNMLSYQQPGKYYLKKALKGMVPEYVLQRPKRGFTPPVSHWLREILGRYIHLINVGFLSEQKIIAGSKLNLIVNCWPIMPMYWYPIYQLLLLEIYGRIYYYGLDPDEIS